jgi:hypothetical protein
MAQRPTRDVQHGAALVPSRAGFVQRAERFPARFGGLARLVAEGDRHRSFGSTPSGTSRPCPTGHPQPGTHVPAAGVDELIPLVHADRHHHRERTQSSPAAKAHPPGSSQPGHRSGECPLPACLTSAGRGRQRETGSCIVLPVDTAPCTSTSTQLAHSRSRPNACSPDSLCLVRHDGGQNPLWRWVKTPPTAVASTGME